MKKKKIFYLVPVLILLIILSIFLLNKNEEWKEKSYSSQENQYKDLNNNTCETDADCSKGKSCQAKQICPEDDIRLFQESACYLIKYCVELR